MDLAAGTNARFQFASDQSLLVYFDKQVGQHRSPDLVGTGAGRPLQEQFTLEANENVRKLLRLLESEPVAGSRHLYPLYCSLLVKVVLLLLGHEEWGTGLRKHLEKALRIKSPWTRQVVTTSFYAGM